jgi:hypothetical protein
MIRLKEKAAVAKRTAPSIEAVKQNSQNELVNGMPCQYAENTSGHKGDTSNSKLSIKSKAAYRIESCTELFLKSVWYEVARARTRTHTHTHTHSLLNHFLGSPHLSYSKYGMCQRTFC